MAEPHHPALTARDLDNFGEFITRELGIIRGSGNPNIGDFHNLANTALRAMRAMSQVFAQQAAKQEQTLRDFAKHITENVRAAGAAQARKDAQTGVLLRDLATNFATAISRQNATPEYLKKVFARLNEEINGIAEIHRQPQQQPPQPEPNDAAAPADRRPSAPPIVFTKGEPSDGQPPEKPVIFQADEPTLPQNSAPPSQQNPGSTDSPNSVGSFFNKHPLLTAFAEAASR